MIVATAGHIDHGKTALVRALTGVETDRLKEEKARGITIDLGFAYVDVKTANGATRTIGFVDVPGHEKFIHNMLAGTSGVDCALLVVAADDGIMPQTREHLAILGLMGIRRAVVAVSKVDRVGPAQLATVMAEVAKLMTQAGFPQAELIPLSSVTGQGIDRLRSVLGRLADASAARAGDTAFRLAVDRVFTLQGTGTVVTGTVLSGIINVGDDVVISPAGQRARVRGIHAQNRQAASAAAGDRAALNLSGDGVAREAIRRGDMVVASDLHAPSRRIDARLRWLASEIRSPGQWMPVRFHHATGETAAHLVLLDDAPILPGGEGLVQIVLDTPVSAAVGDRFVVRESAAQRTMGGGVLLDLRAPMRKRRTSARRAQLAAACREGAAALAALADAPPFYVGLEAFARDRALTAATVAAEAERLDLLRLTVGRETVGLTRARWESLRAAIVTALDDYHRRHSDDFGIGLERLRLAEAPQLPAPLFRVLLQALARDGDIVMAGAWVRRPMHEVRLQEADDAVWQQIAPRLGGAERFRPPRVRDLAGELGVPEADIRRILKLVARLGQVDEVAHDHFFLRTTVGEMVDIICVLAVGSDEAGAAAAIAFTAAHFRDKVQNGRKVAIQILEFFDRHGVTLRRGDLRRINRHRLDLFRRQTDDDAAIDRISGREASPVGRPDFKSGRGRETVPGGFDSHSLPPQSQRVGRPASPDVVTTGTGQGR